MIIRYGVGGVLLLLFVIFFFHTTVGQKNPGKINCICVDPGHGGRDPGAVGKYSYEKDIALKIALKLRELIKEQFPDIKLVYTRDKDVFIDLDKRGKVANDSHADMFISIHINSTESRSPHGVSTYVLGLHRSAENLRVAMKENSVIKYEKDYSVKYDGFDPSRAESYIIFSLMQNLYLEKSLHLAGLVQEEMVSNTQRTDRGVLQAGYLVLKDAAMPAILIEACFISNEEEERYLNTSAAQEKIAVSIFNAIKHYKSSVEKNSNLLTANKDKVKESADEAPVEVDGLFYAVQIASSPNKIRKFPTLTLTEEIKELKIADRYRYYVFEADNYDEVKRNLGKVKSEIRDCFIIAVHKGNIIPLSEAKALEKKLK